MQHLLLETQMALDSGSVAQGTLRAQERGPSRPGDRLHGVSRRSLVTQHSSREPSSPPTGGVWHWVQPQISPFPPVCSGFWQERPRGVCHLGRSVAGVGCAEATWVEEPTTPPTGWRAFGWGQEPREGQATPTRSSRSSWTGVAAPSCLCPVPDGTRGSPRAPPTTPRPCQRARSRATAGRPPESRGTGQSLGPAPGTEASCSHPCAHVPCQQRCEINTGLATAAPSCRAPGRRPGPLAASPPALPQ